MNPDKTIRPWLIACAKQFGVDQAHLYRWPDADTRAQVPYFTYRPIRGLSASTGFFDLTTASENNTVHRRTAQPHKQHFKIDLYRRYDGMAILERCCLAVKNGPVFKKLFDEHGCSFFDQSEVTDETDDKRWESENDCHFQVFVIFNENIEITVDEVNGEVEQVDLTMSTGDPTLEIDRTGVS